MTGTIKRLVTERGFGFLKDEDGQSVFFHRNSLQPGLEFEMLELGDSCEFTIEQTAKGLNATNIRRL